MRDNHIHVSQEFNLHKILTFHHLPLKFSYASKNRWKSWLLMKQQREINTKWIVMNKVVGCYGVGWFLVLLSGAFKLLWILSCCTYWGANKGTLTIPLDKTGVSSLPLGWNRGTPAIPLGWNKGTPPLFGWNMDMNVHLVLCEWKQDHLISLG